VRGLREKHLKGVDRDDVGFDKLGSTLIGIDPLCRARNAKGKHCGHEDEQ
jgi:hypothetical protein